MTFHFAEIRKWLLTIDCTKVL